MSNSPKTVLYVAADESSATDIRSCLGTRDYEVVHRSTPNAALDELREGVCRVVVLNIDLNGPVNNDLLLKIKNQDGALQVIVLMPPRSVTKALDAMRSGAEACLLKPVDDLNDLVEAVDLAFEKIDRWWIVLAQLSRKRNMSRMTSHTP